MQKVQRTVLNRDDTMFGVCEALGEDFGFNPIFLRIAFGVALIWSPILTVGVYAAAGVVVAISRLLAPNPANPAFVEAEAGEPALVEAAGARRESDNDALAETMAAAA